MTIADLDKRETVTMPEAAEMLSMSVDTIRRYTTNGTLPVIRLGKTSRIPAKALKMVLTGWQNEAKGN